MTAIARGYKQAGFVVAVCISLFLAGFAQASTVKGGQEAPDHLTQLILQFCLNWRCFLGPLSNS